MNGVQQFSNWTDASQLFLLSNNIKMRNAISIILLALVLDHHHDHKYRLYYQTIDEK